MTCVYWRHHRADECGRRLTGLTGWTHGDWPLVIRPSTRV